VNRLLVYVVIIGVLMIFMMTRGNRRRQAQAQQLQSALTVGAQVRTIGGVLGDVIEVTDEYVVIETTPGVKLKFAKNAIAGVTQPPEPESEGEPFGGEPQVEAGDDGSGSEAEPQDAVQARVVESPPFATPEADEDSEPAADSDREIDAVLDSESESANR
jgi:preprotein translocase subunit YajC